MSKIGRQKIKEFVEELSSSKPTPGGGAAAALGGSMAASLVEMVAALTIKKKSDEDERVVRRMRYLAREAKKYKQRLLQLVDKDIAAYNQVVEAYRLLKEDKERKAKIEKALKTATDVPLETAEISKAVLKLSQEVLKKGNKNALSDAKTAVFLAQAAIKSALANVSINLDEIRDINYRKKIGLVVARIKTN